MNYPVYFENSYGIRREIGQAETMYDVFEIVDKFLKDREYVSYYNRLNRLDSEYQLDVGSHSEFFYFSADIKIQQ